MKESGNYAVLVATRLKSLFSARNLTIAQHAAKLFWLNIIKIIISFLFRLWQLDIHKV